MGWARLDPGIRNRTIAATACCDGVRLCAQQNGSVWWHKYVYGRFYGRYLGMGRRRLDPRCRFRTASREWRSHGLCWKRMRRFRRDQPSQRRRTACILSNHLGVGRKPLGLAAGHGARATVAPRHGIRRPTRHDRDVRGLQLAAVRGDGSGYLGDTWEHNGATGSAGQLAISGLQLSPPALTAGQPAQLTITLSGPAQAGSPPVNLSVDPPNGVTALVNGQMAPLPVQVRVTPGSATQLVQLSAGPPSTQATIKVELQASSKSVVFVILS